MPLHLRKYQGNNKWFVYGHQLINPPNITNWYYTLVIEY